jgi:hypothetical protein
MGIINILKKINLQGKFGTGMVIGAGNLLSAIGRGAFVNSSTELYSQFKDISKDVDVERVAGKGFAGGFYGLFGSLAGAGGKTIKVGNGDLQTAAEAGASIFTGIAQAAADSMNSKDSKNNKDGQK